MVQLLAAGEWAVCLEVLGAPVVARYSAGSRCSGGAWCCGVMKAWVRTTLPGGAEDVAEALQKQDVVSVVEAEALRKRDVVSLVVAAMAVTVTDEPLIVAHEAVSTTVQAVAAMHKVSRAEVLTWPCQCAMGSHS